MNQSLVRRHLFFLTELGNETSVRVRKGLIRMLNIYMMTDLTKVVECIMNGSIPILVRDYRIFRRHVGVLRQILSPRISLQRKKRMLVCYNRLIPRLLRENYLNQTIVIELRSVEN